MGQLGTPADRTHLGRDPGPARAGRDDRQPPRVQESLQLPVAERIMCGVYGLVVLTEEVRAFALGQVPENGVRAFGSSPLTGSENMQPSYGPDQARLSRWRYHKVKSTLQIVDRRAYRQPYYRALATVLTRALSVRLVGLWSGG